MNFDPQKFYVGLVDFFSILLPGALLGFVLLRHLHPESLDESSVKAFAVFLFVSYLLGNLLFLIGSWLDNWFYDPLRNLTRNGQMKRLSGGKMQSPSCLRFIAQSKMLFGPNSDAAVQVVGRIKARQLEKLSANGSINAFQWCKAFLSKNHPGGFLEVQRFEANSKFFRSFVVTLAFLSLFYLIISSSSSSSYGGMASVLCAALIVPALWRYTDQRFKATQQAYWQVLTLEAMKEGGPQRIERDDGLTHAGGVVCRVGGNDEEEFLLVQASRNRNDWVLPKGHIEPGEEPSLTAVREVHEETGHWARVEEWLEDSLLIKDKPTPMVRWFVMRWDGEKEARPPEGRQHEWLVLKAALDRATYEETRKLLDQAADRLKKRKSAGRLPRSSN
jgi:8-oxo-dGTP pyrophosphatase MutT (NUDIX family)